MNEVAFWNKVRVDLTSGCMEWKGTRNWAGYGVVAVARRRRRVAHRVAYEMARGPIPAGLEVDHLCRNRACVNPEHLEAVPHVVNVLRGQAPSAIAVRSEACLRGHPKSDANTYRMPNGSIRCRPCSADLQRRRRALRAAAYAEEAPDEGNEWQERNE